MKKILFSTKNAARSVLNILGLDFLNQKKRPLKSLLGLKKIFFQYIIDVGANKGQFAQYISRIYPKSELYCFEPLPEAFEKLKIWADNQRSSRIHLVNMAIGDKLGYVEMNYHIEHSASSSVLKTTPGCETTYPMTQSQKVVSVPMSTLDSAIGRELDNMAGGNILIKLDVQGFEDRVIRGGSKVFSLAKAVILEVCLDSLYEGQAKFCELSQLMDGYGYRYAGNLDQSYGDDGHVIFLDSVFVRQ